MNEKNFYDDPLPKPKRSTFLMVLCILSFIGSTYTICTGVAGYFMADRLGDMQNKNMSEFKKTEKELEKSDKPGDELAKKMLKNSAAMMDPAKTKPNALISACMGLLTLAGAILMWRLIRTGYFLYVAGVLGSVIAPIVIFGTENFVAVISSSIGAIFGIAFIIMYGMCLKEMKPAEIS